MVQESDIPISEFNPDLWIRTQRFILDGVDDTLLMDHDQYLSQGSPDVRLSTAIIKDLKAIQRDHQNDHHLNKLYSKRGKVYGKQTILNRSKFFQRHPVRWRLIVWMCFSAIMTVMFIVTFEEYITVKGEVRFNEKNIPRCDIPFEDTIKDPIQGQFSPTDAQKELLADYFSLYPERYGEVASSLKNSENVRAVTAYCVHLYDVVAASAHLIVVFSHGFSLTYAVLFALQIVFSPKLQYMYHKSRSIYSFEQGQKTSLQKNASAKEISTDNDLEDQKMPEVGVDGAGQSTQIESNDGIPDRVFYVFWLIATMLWALGFTSTNKPLRNALRFFRHMFSLGMLPVIGLKFKRIRRGYKDLESSDIMSNNIIADKHDFEFRFRRLPFLRKAVLVVYIGFAAFILLLDVMGFVFIVTPLVGLMFLIWVPIIVKLVSLETKHDQELSLAELHVAQANAQGAVGLHITTSPPMIIQQVQQEEDQKHHRNHPHEPVKFALFFVTVLLGFAIMIPILEFSINLVFFLVRSKALRLLGLHCMNSSMSCMVYAVSVGSFRNTQPSFTTMLVFPLQLLFTCFASFQVFRMSLNSPDLYVSIGIVILFETYRDSGLWYDYELFQKRWRGVGRRTTSGTSTTAIGSESLVDHQNGGHQFSVAVSVPFRRIANNSMGSGDNNIRDSAAFGQAKSVGEDFVFNELFDSMKTTSNAFFTSVSVGSVGNNMRKFRSQSSNSLQRVRDEVSSESRVATLTDKELSAALPVESIPDHINDVDASGKNTKKCPTRTPSIKQAWEAEDGSENNRQQIRYTRGSDEGRGKENMNDTLPRNENDPSDGTLDLILKREAFVLSFYRLFRWNNQVGDVALSANMIVLSAVLSEYLFTRLFPQYSSISLLLTTDEELPLGAAKTQRAVDRVRQEGAPYVLSDSSSYFRISYTDSEFWMRVCGLLVYICVEHFQVQFCRKWNMRRLAKAILEIPVNASSFSFSASSKVMRQGNTNTSSASRQQDPLGQVLSIGREVDLATSLESLTAILNARYNSMYIPLCVAMGSCSIIAFLDLFIYLVERIYV